MRELAVPDEGSLHFFNASSLIPVLSLALICTKCICFYAIFKPAVHSGPYETPERHHCAGHLLQPYPGHSQGKNRNFVIIWAALRNRIHHSILTDPDPFLAINAPMIYAAPFIMLSTFLGPKWHSPMGSKPFHRAQKSLDFKGPTPSHLPK
jgi:hypothetical protein